MKVSMRSEGHESQGHRLRERELREVGTSEGCRFTLLQTQVASPFPFGLDFHLCDLWEVSDDEHYSCGWNIGRVLGSYSGEDAHVDTFLDLVVEMIFMSLILDKTRIKS